MKSNLKQFSGRWESHFRGTRIFWLGLAGLGRKSAIFRSRLSRRRFFICCSRFSGISWSRISGRGFWRINRTHPSNSPKSWPTQPPFSRTAATSALSTRQNSSPSARKPFSERSSSQPTSTRWWKTGKTSIFSGRRFEARCSSARRRLTRSRFCRGRIYRRFIPGI